MNDSISQPAPPAAAPPKSKAKRPSSSRKPSGKKSGARRPAHASSSTGAQWQESVRKIALAGVGAVVLAQEGLGDLFDKLVEKGQKADIKIKNIKLDPKTFDLRFEGGRDILKEVEARGKKLRSELEEARGRIEHRVEKFVDKVRNNTVRNSTVRNGKKSDR